MAPLQTIAYEDFQRSAAGTLINRLIAGEILLLRGVPEIHQAQQYIRRQVAAQARLADIEQVDDFFRAAENAYLIVSPKSADLSDISATAACSAASSRLWQGKSADRRNC